MSQSQRASLNQSAWYPLRYHEKQSRLYYSDARFILGPCGRRSGKTEIIRRKGVREGCADTRFDDLKYIFGAPTWDQAKRLFWNKLKKLVPPFLVASRSESELTITLKSGTRFCVVGLDKPERIEGEPIDWIAIDEFADVKEDAWEEHVRPALSTPGRLGKAILFGVPGGRNHYYKLWQAHFGRTGWEGYTWPSSDIVDPEEIKDARETLDELTYRQEYEASFINFAGRAYYTFDRDIHAVERLHYDPTLDVDLSFDFNVEPGVAGIHQEQMYRGSNPAVDRTKPITMTLKEVHIPRNSNTRIVANKCLEWLKLVNHRGRVILHGDATGGARKTSALEGSDWDIINATLRPHLQDRLVSWVARSNPMERSRVNSVNSRFLSIDGVIRWLVDPVECPNIIKDFEGVTMIEGGSGEIDKKADKSLTHHSDHCGYLCYDRHPLLSQSMVHHEESFV